MNKAKIAIISSILIVSSSTYAFSLLDDINNFFQESFSGIIKTDILPESFSDIIKTDIVEKNSVHKIAFLDSDKIEFEVSMNKDGEFDGLWTKYNQQGSIIQQKDYIDGKLDGVAKFYTADGVINQISEYKDGQLDGVNETFKVDEKSGTKFLSRQDQYKDGNRHGETKFFNKMGKLVSKMLFEDGIQQGKALDYRDNGEVKTEIAYVDGKMNGLWIDYFKGGHVEHQVAYKNGEKDGEEVFMSITRIP
jgi:antitoxin component YwqK of YwqJK toxin-antitoxin module